MHGESDLAQGSSFPIEVKNVMTASDSIPFSAIVYDKFWRLALLDERSRPHNDQALGRPIEKT